MSRMYNTVNSFLLAALLLLLLQGCASLDKNGEVGASADVSVMGLDVSSLNAVFRNGLLQARFELHNTTRRSLNVQFKVHWLDANGNVLETEASYWEPLGIAPGSTRALSQTAPVQKVRNFRLEIK